MILDLHRTPFSVAGSYFVFSQRLMPESPADTVHLQSVRAPLWRPNALFDLQCNGSSSAIGIEAEPGLLTLSAPGGGTTQITMPEPAVIHLRGRGMPLDLVGGGGRACRVGDGLWKMRMHGTQFVLRKLAGRITVEAPWTRKGQHHSTPSVTVQMQPGSDGVWEAVIEEYESGWIPHEHTTSFDEGVRKVTQEFEAFLAQVPPVSPAYAEARELAAYVSWSSIVRPAGLLGHRAMLMSKYKMHATWSWDNCFNAAAMVHIDPQLAEEQILAVAEHAHPVTGLFPDLVSAVDSIWGTLKPPVYGWALSRMMSAAPDYFAGDRLHRLYQLIAGSTRGWFTCRDDDGDGAPSYYHGNDSGWDNATVFDPGCPVEGPDLLALLWMQCKVLADVADRLQLTDDVQTWRATAERLRTTLLGEFWDGRRFVFRSAVEHRPIVTKSLLHFLPLAVGADLPKEIRETLIADLTADDGHLTPHGLATERPDSDQFIDDGYWRGPIWAPPTMLIIDGLLDAGETALAHDLARRFCDLCRNGGFAENFNCLTGEPLRDPAYTWTSSVFLILASHLESVQSSGPTV